MAEFRTGRTEMWLWERPKERRSTKTHSLHRVDLCTFGSHTYAYTRTHTDRSRIVYFFSPSNINSLAARAYNRKLTQRRFRNRLKGSCATGRGVFLCTPYRVFELFFSLFTHFPLDDSDTTKSILFHSCQFFFLSFRLLPSKVRVFECVCSSCARRKNHKSNNNVYGVTKRGGGS